MFLVKTNKLGQRHHLPTKIKEIKIQRAAVVAAFVCIFLNSASKAYAQLVAPDQANTICDLETIIQNILRIAVPLAGIALFVMLVWGGISYLISGGNPEAVKKAQGTITYAIAGIALMALAWIILAFIETFTGVPVTQFSICQP